MANLIYPCDFKKVVAMFFLIFLMGNTHTHTTLFTFQGSNLNWKRLKTRIPGRIRTPCVIVKFFFYSLSVTTRLV